ncbi:aromatic ring-hydroxylating dioxygenase subunit alpha [Waterburya agarophytonicola K14]|uniref:Aromatic ring-hydroxylating dioxygenase subunit alpha n=1 Tax=Waterburya agarophytonicola KI4 TaxID=2874699 RepID=A0A964BT22_9CYAN|nr:aromatic ring-hydroxylating dioxygenase subunit alpha [Waterburya agarophytonicola]MCC0179148.1 aromatic ring-hydroxylating dioxygenase subunit alpha [Waterburya agarophytonicola KI4]
MLVTKEEVFKRFWYPVMPVVQMSDQPQSFELLGQNLVLWLDNSGSVVVANDRCCHRSAQLSKGQVIDGNIACPYHGWQYNAEGVCTKVPQLEDSSQIPKTYQIKTYQAQERYGYIWVCLGEPLNEIPNIKEASDPDFRLIPEFYETWNCGGLRVMENEFDLAHPTFVHTTTFGSEDHPIPDRVEVEETDYGITETAVLGVVNPQEQQQNLKMDERVTTRNLDLDWYLPFTCKLRINYPNGLVHIIVNTATPINDSSSQIVQFCLRNDTEAETKADDVVAFDRAVTLEDKAVLETTDYDVPLDLKQEQHMMTDKPGILMRKKLSRILAGNK